MNSPAATQIPKIDYTTTLHPSGVKALSLKDAPALIESLLPVQKLSIDVYKERKGGASQRLTALGSYWKGRKPLVLNKACILASLLPDTGNPLLDLDVFELLMGMDDISLAKRLGLPKPSDILENLQIEDIGEYFKAPIPEQMTPLPKSAPFKLANYFWIDSKGVRRRIRLAWREDLSDVKKWSLAAKLHEREAYRDVAKRAQRSEELTDTHAHVWTRVNTHLGTAALSFPELVEQLGVMRFGHRPTVADTFSGSGQIPFAAAELGCDVVASDLNPVANMLTWGALNIVGASAERRLKLQKEQAELVQKVRIELDSLGFEVEGDWRGKVYLYCIEATCPSSGWSVPLLSSLVISKGTRVVAKLIPDERNKRFDVQVISNASSEEMAAAEKGTYDDNAVTHVIKGKTYVDSIASIRGDYTELLEGRRMMRNKLRNWSLTDFEFLPSDLYRERLYAVLWSKDDGSARPISIFRSVTPADLEREKQVADYVRVNLDDWQSKGWVPDLRIEAGDETDRLNKERGWAYWHHLFTPRQLAIAAAIRKHCTAELAPSLTQVLNINTRLSRWNGAKGEGRVGSVEGVFDSQAINPLFSYGCRGFSYVTEFLQSKYKVAELSEDVKFELVNEPADRFPYQADIFVTDPPYGDAVKYEEILEFFIAWLRKSPPPEFANWTWDSRRELAVKGEDHDFRLAMVAAYKRMAECMPDNGMQILMFTHQDGNIWADMANIVWASGLRVTAAWYLVTETDSALREGAYVKGTILLVLRKRLGVKRTNQTDLAYELEDEVAEQVKRLTGMNDAVVTDAKRAKDGNLFEDADLQMAGYAAALKVLTKYGIIDGKDMAQEALRPRVAGQTSLVEGLIEFAVNTANKALFPRDLPESVWHDLGPAERFYLKMLEQESHGLNSLDNYQNFAKAFAVKNFGSMMASERANKAALRTAKEFAKSEMNQSSELFETPTRAVLYALMDLQAGKDLDIVLKGLEQNLKVGAFYSARDTLVAIARFVAKMVAVMRPAEASAARVLADGIENQRM